ncbi:MAG: hypothetical protein Q6362_004870 [Candidatus Wukongarchaeota archaeon]|nr:hypothetical protein [Candidatus Wukongarchaeota archaeon]MDO8128760.1 hypothetical protein [Candidatus Wukongarchaeota archaeon]
MEQYESPFGATRRAAKVIWFGMFFGTCAYLLVAVFVAREVAFDTAEKDLNLIVLGVGIIGFFNAFLSKWIPEQLFSSLRKDWSPFTAWIISLTLADTVALFGMIIAFLGADLILMAPFFIAGFGLMIYYRLHLDNYWDRFAERSEIYT